MTTSGLGIRAIGVVVAAAAFMAMRWSTAASLGTAYADASQLRLSLTARPERIERCRELSDEELARLPAHMRLRTQCEGSFARYVLTISVGATEIAHDTLRGGGLRHDRPLHVFREHDLGAGNQRLQIELSLLDEGGVAARRKEDERHDEQADTLLGGRADRERDERARRAAEAMPRRLSLDTVMNVPARRVVLVTFDNNTRRLVARMEP